MEHSLQDFLASMTLVTGLSLVLSFFLHRTKKSPVYRLLYQFWILTSLNFLVSGLVDGQGHWLVSTSMMIAFWSQWIQLRILADIYRLELQPFPWKSVYGLGVALSTGFYFAGFSFVFVSAPVSIVASLPCFYFFYKRYDRSVPSKSPFDYLLLGSVFLTGVHLLDFPFLRAIEWFAIPGFLIYFTLILTKSVTFPYLILGHNERNQQKKLEMELERKTAELNELNSVVTYNSKMTALGEMAGGIAHEINNPLTVIRGSATMILRKVQHKTLTDEFLVRKLEKIDSTVTRISEIIQALRKVSRGATDDPLSSHAVGSLLQDVHKLSQETCHDQGIDLRIKVTDGLESQIMECRPVQISQVLLNLINNSVDALTEGDNSDSPKWIELEVSENESKIEFRVTDSGHGIPAAISEKIFQPFFTTKDVGKGTGIGLSLSSKLVEQQGGKLQLDRNSNQTSFFFRLPFKSPEKMVS